MGSEYRCITLIDAPEEITSASVVGYLAKEGIWVIDILSGGEEVQARSHQEKLPEDYPPVTIDGSGHEPFVSGLVQALGYSYGSRVPLSFDYAGFQVNTTADIIYGRDRVDVVVDFGTFYGEAKAAIEKGGVKVISISPDEKLRTVAKGVLESAEIPYSEDPVFFVANRKLSRATSLTIPGLLISHGSKNKALLTRVRLHPRLLGFLQGRQITAFRIEEAARQAHSEN